MRGDRLEYYDPVYETISFQNGLPSSLGFLTQDTSIDPRLLIRTAEFTRLNFLRQAGLGWLIFPSATHTRFDHSIGCWGLARLAETLIKVRTNRLQQPNSLSFWLKSKELRTEYYLALLCHDIGHGPLSHILEMNEEFISGMKDRTTQLDYEHRAAALLEGTGPLLETWQEIALHRYGLNTKTFQEVRQYLKSSTDAVCIPSICYFITRDAKYHEKCTHPHKENLAFIKELVNGLRSLRRLDHYARDSYFSGQRQFSINLRGFLSNLHVEAQPLSTGMVRLSLAGNGLRYAAGLLLKKRQSLFSTLRTPDIISLHAMANWALSTYLKNLDDLVSLNKACRQIAFMEDDQLFETITGVEHAGGRYIGQRIRSARPYTYLGKYSNIELQEKAIDLAEFLDGTAKTSDFSPPKILFHYENGFWENPNLPEDLFDAQRIFINDTDMSLAEHPDYRNNFQHLKEAANVKYLYIFLKDEGRKEELKSKINSMLGS